MKYTKRRLQHIKPHSATHRWGRVAELRNRVIGSDAWNRMPLRLRHLSLWRSDHINSPHARVQMYARAGGVAPSSDLKLKGPVSKMRFLTLYGILRK